MRTGRDVVIAALLGAEEFGFGTAALIAVGCVMMRKCQKNLCPVGVATQHPELRKKFMGHVDHAINYFMFVAEETRKYMAELGIAKFDDLIGRTDLLEMDDMSWHYKARGLDLSGILYAPKITSQTDAYCTSVQDHGISDILDRKLIELSKPALDTQKKVSENLTIKNINRSTGAMLSGKISKIYEKAGLPEDTININFTGYAGQSFGAFLVNGVTFRLYGQANDYVGKGMSGGKIIIRPPEDCDIKPYENIIAGNTLLYGATGGELYISGMVGERFAVRNSGCRAVVEGAGDHGCEYMTGGVVVILGKTGINFAAGMSGGIAYIFDEDSTFKSKVNKAMVNFEEMNSADENELKSLIENHVNYTMSDRGQDILKNWNSMKQKFVKIMPIEYKRVLEEREMLQRAKGA
jgi:glutamate synthase domain-containing protein 3